MHRSFNGHSTLRITLTSAAASRNMQSMNERQTAEALYRDLRRLDDPTYTPETCDEIAALIAEIAALKREHDAAILAHNYQRPEIFEVADVVGDSLELAREGARVAAGTIVLCGVHFMAETAKILSPEKTVLLPDLRAGCSLADSVSGDSLRARAAELRALYPDLQVMCYVNTSAEVKAASDVCCTSSNAVTIARALPTHHILFVPDRNLAAYVQENTDKTIIAWDGGCYVHQQIRPEQLLAVKRHLPQVEILAHPECRADVLGLADQVLSTSGMIRHASASAGTDFLVVTECGLSDRLLLEVPGKRFYKACKLCQYMKMITLEATRDALRHQRYAISLPEDVRQGALRALTRMLDLSAR
jgi:quinolinate synthase